MHIDYEAAMEMQRICTGETRMLSRGQIAGQAIDIEKIVKNFGSEKADACRRFYETLLQDDEKKPYDAELLLEETDAIKAQLDAFLSDSGADGSFQSIFEAISDFFMTPPFEGMDHIEYGVNEVCVFSVLEYFLQKTTDDYDHQKIHDAYWDSIASRTYVEVADHWIAVFDDLQKRYGQMTDGFGAGARFDEDPALAEQMAACCILAIAAIRDQDDFALDMAQAGAAEKGRVIMEMYLADEYKEGESAFTDNVIKLYVFVERFVQEHQHES